MKAIFSKNLQNKAARRIFKTSAVSFSNMLIKKAPKPSNSTTWLNSSKANAKKTPNTAANVPTRSYSSTELWKERLSHEFTDSVKKSLFILASRGDFCYGEAWIPSGDESKLVYCDSWQVFSQFKKIGFIIFPKKRYKTHFYFFSCVYIFK